MEALCDLGPMTPADATAAVAERMQIPREIVEARRSMPTWSANGLPLLQHRLRWVRQELVQRGFVASAGRGIWDIAERGRNFVLQAKPGIVVNVFETNLGVAMFAEARSALAAVQDDCLQLCFTSPPYPGQSREYGTFSEEACVELILDYCRTLRPKLRSDANLFLNLGNVTLPGGTSSLYQASVLMELCRSHGYRFIQPHAWVSTSKIPGGHYVTHERTRLKDGFEMIYQLGCTPDVKADNRKILEPYKDTMRRVLARGGDSRESRPSRHGHCGRSFTNDNGGSISANVQILANAASNTAYHRLTRAHRLRPHPARFPADLPEKAIKYTTDPGDCVADFMAGSLVVPEVCERLGRRWVASDLTLDYLRGGELLFRKCDGYVSHAVEGEVLIPPEWRVNRCSRPLRV